MKKLGFLLLLLSVGMFSYGCKPADKPAAPAGDAAPAAEEKVDDAGAPAAADAKAEEPKKEEEKK